VSSLFGKWQSSLAEEEAPARLAGGKDASCDMHPAKRQQRSKVERCGLTIPPVLRTAT